jgi:hypothetical protein
MDQRLKDLESDDLLVVLRLMPGPVISQLIKASGPPPGSVLRRVDAAGLDGGGFDDLLETLDTRVRRLAAHKVAGVFRKNPPTYREAVSLLCHDAGVDVQTDDSAAEMERKFLVRTYEGVISQNPPPQGHPPGRFDTFVQAVAKIARKAWEMPTVQNLLAKAKANPKLGVAVGVAVTVAVLAAVCNHLARPAYRRLEECVRVIAAFRQASFFECIAEDAA